MFDTRTKTQSELMHRKAVEILESGIPESRAVKILTELGADRETAERVVWDAFCYVYYSELNAN